MNSAVQITPDLEILLRETRVAEGERSREIGLIEEWLEEQQAVEREYY